jgi:hypothetical protein
MSVNIKIDNDYRVISDSKQYTLQKYRGKCKKSGEDVYHAVAFSQNIAYLLKAYASRFTRTSSATSIEELVSTYQSAVKRLEGLLAPLNETVKQ